MRTRRALPVLVAAVALLAPPRSAVAQSAPRITDASLRLVELRSGATAVGLLLRGTDLHLLEDAAVMYEGRPVSDVSVTLLDTRDPTLRGLTLEAAAGARDFSGYRLQVSYRGALLDTPVQVDVGGGATVPAIDATDPRGLVLEPGGRAVGVRIAGSGLDRITGWEVLLGGRPMSDVTVRWASRPTATDGAIEVTALASAPGGADYELRAIGEAGTATVPVAIEVAVPAALAELRLSATEIVGGGEVIAVVRLDRPAPAGGAVVSLSVNDPTVASLEASATVPGGQTEVALRLGTQSVGGDAPVTVSGSYGGATRTASLTVTAPPFTPVSLTTDALVMTGLRFQPVTLTTDPLVMTGLRFEPVTLTTDALVMTGLRFEPITINTDPLIMTGLREDQR